ncbi:FP [Rachiplusia nu nucleopolyhedrovirus]|uniref:FP n=1 Tax=Rachiplusia nu nucleopolyhedrovirus TaxID=2605775 RepID=A0AAF1DB66_9ABAC|nr:FP [Rachiplusia nu nucleopolyhedrovirus]QEI03706.1 FP [Rachiplusia nu nucleopolyhedrovirus]
MLFSRVLRTTALPWYILLVVPLCYTQRTPDDVFDVTPLPHTSGLYFQRIQEMQFVENTWHFVIEVDHASVFIRLKELYEQVKILSKFVKEHTDFKNCSNSAIVETEIDNAIVNRIVNLVNEHNELDSRVQHAGHFKKHDKYSLSRSKRGLFNPVGSLYKYLFGMMDNDDAHLLHSLANSSNALDNQVKQVTNNLIEFETLVAKEFNKLEKEEQLCEYVATKMHIICSELNRLQTVYDKLNDGVDKVKTKVLSSFIMSSEKLLSEMQNVTKNLPKGLWWPVELEHENMHMLIDSLINTHVFITNKRTLLFIVEVPLVNQQMYDLYQIVPIPFCNKQSKCAIILPDSKYLGVSADKRSFVRFEETTDKCRIAHNLMLCYVPQIIRDSNQAELCDIRIFLRNDKDINFERDCDVRVGKFESEIFYPIADYNKWLYVLENDVEVNVQCLETPSSAPVYSAYMARSIILPAGTGIIKATGTYSCKLVTKRNKLSTFDQTYSLEKNLELPINTMFNLSAVLKDLDQIQLQTMKMNNDLEHSSLHKLTDRLVDLRRIMNNNTKFVGDDVIDETENSWVSNFFQSVGADFHVVKMVLVWVILSLIALAVFKVYSTCCPGTFSDAFRCCQREDPTVVCVDREMHYMKSNNRKKNNNAPHQQHLLALQTKLDNYDD